MNYEVLYYTSVDMMGDPIFKEFKTRKQALNFYEQHKNDNDKFGWWVTKRDQDGYVVEDIIY